MKIPKTLEVINCKTCGGEYFGNDTKLILNPGNENELPDEITVILRKIRACQGCKVREGRTKGGRNKRFER